MAEKTGDGGCAIHLFQTVTKKKRRENLVVGMGGSDSKLNFRKAVVQLTTKKTVREIMTMHFLFLWHASFELLRIRQSMADPPDNQLNEETKITNHRSFSGCRSDR